jgi:putative transposase
MARKGKSTEEIIQVLREAEVRLGQGETVGKIGRGFGISEQTYYEWCREYGGLKLDQEKRLKELERENERSRNTVRLYLRGGDTAATRKQAAKRPEKPQFWCCRRGSTAARRRRTGML